MWHSPQLSPKPFHVCTRLKPRDQHSSLNILIVCQTSETTSRLFWMFNEQINGKIWHSMPVKGEFVKLSRSKFLSFFFFFISFVALKLNCSKYFSAFVFFCEEIKFGAKTHKRLHISMPKRFSFLPQVHFIFFLLWDRRQHEVRFLITTLDVHTFNCWSSFLLALEMKEFERLINECKKRNKTSHEGFAGKSLTRLRDSDLWAEEIDS